MVPAIAIGRGLKPLDARTDPRTRLIKLVVKEKKTKYGIFA
jgi:hypothetical protein